MEVTYEELQMMFAKTRHEKLLIEAQALREENEELKLIIEGMKSESYTNNVKIDIDLPVIRE